MERGRSGRRERGARRTRRCASSSRPIAYSLIPRSAGPTTEASAAGPRRRAASTIASLPQGEVPPIPESQAKLVVFDLLHDLEDEAIEIYERGKVPGRGFQARALPRRGTRPWTPNSAWPRSTRSGRRWLKAYLDLQAGSSSWSRRSPFFAIFSTWSALHFRSLVLLKLQKEPSTTRTTSIPARGGRQHRPAQARRGPAPQQEGRGPAPPRRHRARSPGIAAPRGRARAEARRPLRPTSQGGDTGLGPSRAGLG